MDQEKKESVSFRLPRLPEDSMAVALLGLSKSSSKNSDNQSQTFGSLFRAVKPIDTKAPSPPKPMPKVFFRTRKKRPLPPVIPDQFEDADESDLVTPAVSQEALPSASDHDDYNDDDSNSNNTAVANHDYSSSDVPSTSEAPADSKEDDSPKAKKAKTSTFALPKADSPSVHPRPPTEASKEECSPAAVTPEPSLADQLINHCLANNPMMIAQHKAILLQGFLNASAYYNGNFAQATPTFINNPILPSPPTTPCVGNAAKAAPKLNPPNTTTTAGSKNKEPAVSDPTPPCPFVQPNKLGAPSRYGPAIYNLAAEAPKSTAQVPPISIHNPILPTSPPATPAATASGENPILPNPFTAAPAVFNLAAGAAWKPNAATTNSKKVQMLQQLQPKLPIAPPKKVAPVERKKKHKYKGSQVDKWSRRYEQAKVFRTKHGHCIIPNEYEEIPGLGSWAKRQRYQYQIFHKGNAGGRPSAMTPQRIQLLDKIGFCWHHKDRRWLKRYSELLHFIQEYGHAAVPTYFPENQELAGWVKVQRRQYKLHQTKQKNSMTQERIKMLNRVGFVWSIKEIPDIFVGGRLERLRSERKEDRKQWKEKEKKEEDQIVEIEKANMEEKKEDPPTLEETPPKDQQQEASSKVLEQNNKIPTTQKNMLAEAKAAIMKKDRTIYRKIALPTNTQKPLKRVAVPEANALKHVDKADPTLGGIFKQVVSASNRDMAFYNNPTVEAAKEVPKKKSDNAKAPAVVPSLPIYNRITAAAALNTVAQVPNDPFEEITLLAENYTPSDNDVICCRGKKFVHHPGNIAFHSLIENHTTQYFSAAKFQRTIIVSEIIKTVRSKSPRGGFVRLTDEKWYEIGTKSAREKVNQAFHVERRKHGHFTSKGGAKHQRFPVGVPCLLPKTNPSTNTSTTDPDVVDLTMVEDEETTAASTVTTTTTKAVQDPKKNDNAKYQVKRSLPTCNPSSTASSATTTVATTEAVQVPKKSSGTKYQVPTGFRSLTNFDLSMIASTATDATTTDAVEKPKMNENLKYQIPARAKYQVPVRSLPNYNPSMTASASTAIAEAVQVPEKNGNAKDHVPEGVRSLPNHNSSTITETNVVDLTRQEDSSASITTEETTSPPSEEKKSWIGVKDESDAAFALLSFFG